MAKQSVLWVVEVQWLSGWKLEAVHRTREGARSDARLWGGGTRVVKYIREA